MDKENTKTDRCLRIEEIEDLIEAYKSDHPDKFQQEPLSVTYKRFISNGKMYVMLEFPTDKILPEFAVVKPQEMLRDLQSQELTS